MSIPINTIILDLETARSADDCRHCGQSQDAHEENLYTGTPLVCPGEYELPIGTPLPQFEAIGWNNKPALGLSIGAYWDYQDSRIHWFDEHTLAATVQLFVQRQPLLVSFNGIGFDFPLMRGLLRRQAEHNGALSGIEEPLPWLVALCDTFKAQCATSYDLLAEIWKVDPDRKFERGLNSLDAIAQANGLGAKLSHGAQAPRDWAAGRYADVLNYCADDVYKTKMLFEQIVEYGEILRGDGEPIALPAPAPETL